MKQLRTLLLAAGIVATTSTVLAHHGRGATYDMNKQITLQGTISPYPLRRDLPGRQGRVWCRRHVGNQGFRDVERK